MASFDERQTHFNDWPNAQGFDVHYEERTVIELETRGTIPAYAAGVLFRSGLGPREVEGPNGYKHRVNHWFDNFAQVHRFQIHEPSSKGECIRVTYNSRSTCDGMIEKVKKSGKLNDVTFAAKYDPCMSLFQKLQSVFFPSRQADIATHPDDVSISVTLSADFPGLSRTGEKLEAGHDRCAVSTLCNKTDSSLFQMLDPETLEPIGLARQSTLHPQLKGPASAAHAKSCPVTGDVFNYNLEFGRTGTYRVFTASASTGRTSILATIHHSPAYLHSLFLTEHYVILCVWNSFFALGGAKILWEKNIVDALAPYDPSRPATWFVIDRIPPENGGRGLISTYESDPFYCFHTINAFESPSPTSPGETDIVADLIAYPSIDCLKRFYIDNLLSTSETAPSFSDLANATSHPYYQRFRLPGLPHSHPKSPLKASVEYSGKGQGAYFELPAINSALLTKSHRYIYGVLDTGRSTFWDGLIKYDTQTCRYTEWSVHGHSAGEPIFVADPTSKEEDGGVLLSVVLDGNDGKSYLLVLDARTMEELGRACVPGVVGFAFHGCHVKSGTHALQY